MKNILFVFLLFLVSMTCLNVSLCFDKTESSSFSLKELEALAERPTYEYDNPETWFRMESYMCRSPYSSSWEKVCESSGIRMECDEKEQQSCPDGRPGLGNQD